MVERPYMVIDWRADHSFRVPRPDLSAEIGTPNACTQSACHDDKPLQWSIDAYRRWYGEAKRPHFGTVFAAARRGDPAASAELVRLAESDLYQPIVRATALELLARRPDERGTEALRAALDSDEPLLRRTAAAYLPVTSAADVERFAPLLSDPVKAVRMAAVSRLAPVPREGLRPYQREAFERALVEYRQSMAYTLDFASSAFNLGNLEYGLGDREAAEDFYRDALAIDDQFLPAMVNLAVLLNSQGRNDRAERWLRRALALQPDHDATMVSLGLLLAESGQGEEAAEWLARAAEVRTDDARVRYNLGLLLQQLGRMDEAEAALRGALGIEPDGLDYLYALADHLIRRGRLDEAGRVADRLIELYPDRPIGRQLKQAIER
jgi:tetratricopeptide (TPR) repeat protein